MPLYSTTVDISSWKTFDRNLTGSQTAWRWKSYKKGKKLIFLNVLKTCPVKFEQILQETSLFC